MSFGTSMSPSEREATGERFRAWQESQPLLEEQRCRELRTLTDEKALWMTRALFSRRFTAVPGGTRPAWLNSRPYSSD